MTNLRRASMTVACVVCSSMAWATFADDEPSSSGEEVMKLMDENHDGRITAAEHAAGARQMFLEMDADHDGTVTEGEMQVAEKTVSPTKNIRTKSAADKIKVIDGAFMNFEGEVDEILADKGTVRIITTIFGRPTPLELETWQIEKV